MSLLSIREGESGNHHHHHHKAKKEPSSKALLFEKVKEAEERLVRSGSDAVEESLVIISPHGLNPKVKRLVLKPYCLTILGYKTGKFNRQWPLEDIVKVKRHAINHNCFTVTCLERKKKKIKNQRYSFEVKSEIECWRWIEVLTAATSALLSEQNKSSAGSQLSSSDSGTLKRSRSTSAPPAMAPPLMRGQPLNSKTAETDEDEDEENDPYADELSDDDEDDNRHHHYHHGAAQHKEKEVEPAQRKGLVAFAGGAQQKDNWAHFQPSGASNTPPGTAVRNVNYTSPAASVTFNPFAPASGQQPAQPISPYSAHQGQQHSQPQLQQQHSQPQFQQQHSQSQLQQLPPMQPMNHQQAFHMQQQQASHSFSHSPVAQSLASPPSSLNHMSPPSSSAAAQHKAADAPKSASAIYITTMSPPAHMRIVQDLGLLSATGSAAAPTNPTQCGAQVEAALQAARQELSQRAASRGANAVFQTSFSTAFHQWGVTVLACGTACVATMVTN